jgi:site-specific DNA recombinase
MKLTAIYARVSTARQEEEQTIKTQLSAVYDLVKKSGFNVVQEYIDEGWSGDILARPALDKLRQDAKAKLWQVIVVYDPDRIARRYSYQELVMDELREAGIEVVFVTISAPKNSEDKILYGVRGLFSEYERAKIGERFRLGKLRKVKEGHILISEPLYGYRYILKQEKVHGYYEINEEEARVVRMFFDWIDRDGLTLRGIVRKLKELGIKPRKSKRGVWATSTLSKLLKNKAYIGEAHWGSSYAVVPEKPTSKEKYRKIKKSSRRIKPETEWLTIPVPAIIDRDVFGRVQDKIKANFLLSQRNTKNEYLLAGKIHCVCGRKRGGEGPQHGKHLYYRCLDRVLSFPLPHKCREQAVNARIADRLVWDGIVSLMTSPELLKSQIHRWMNSQHTKIDSSGVDTEFVRKEIAKLKDQEDRYNKAYGGGLFTVEQLKEYVVPVRDKVASYESQLLKSEQEERDLQSTPLPDEREVEAFAKEASEVLPNLKFEAKKGIVMNVVEKVVGTSEKLQIYGFIPVTNVNVCTNDRHRRDTPRHGSDENGPKLIPFRFDVNIPFQTVNHIVVPRRKYRRRSKLP